MEQQVTPTHKISFFLFLTFLVLCCRVTYFWFYLSTKFPFDAAEKCIYGAKMDGWGLGCAVASIRFGGEGGKGVVVSVGCSNGETGCGS